MKNSQISDVENVSLIEEDKKIGMNEVVNQNKVINSSLK